MSSNGNKVANQFLIHNNGKTYFQSYDSIIAVKDMEGNVTLDERFWDYSRTTGKYRNQFLDEDKRTTQRKIDNGTYKLDDLNS